MKYDNTTITVAGAELLAHDMAGKNATVIEQLVVSDKQPSDLDNIAQLTTKDFANAIYYPVPIIHHNENTFQPSGLITNNEIIVTDDNKPFLTNIQENDNKQQVGDLANNYNIEMVGLVGHTKDQDNNTLVAVGIADKDSAFQIPANSNVPYQLFFDVAVGYSNASNVIINVTNAGYITLADLMDTLTAYVTIGTAQAIKGDKNFVGDLQYKSVEVATISDTAKQYQNAVNTANSYTNSLIASLQSTLGGKSTGSSTNNVPSTTPTNTGIPSWIPSNAIELPNGWSMDDEDKKQTIGQWYYIRPLNISGYSYQDMPTPPYTLDRNQWYILRSDTWFIYLNNTYYEGGGQATWVFDQNGFHCESSEDDFWSNVPYYNPQPSSSNNPPASTPASSYNPPASTPASSNNPPSSAPASSSVPSTPSVPSWVPSNAIYLNSTSDLNSIINDTNNVYYVPANTHVANEPAGQLNSGIMATGYLVKSSPHRDFVSQGAIDPTPFSLNRQIAYTNNGTIAHRENDDNNNITSWT